MSVHAYMFTYIFIYVGIH